MSEIFQWPLPAHQSHQCSARDETFKQELERNLAGLSVTSLRIGGGAGLMTAVISHRLDFDGAVIFGK
jgi:hypothetical protein